jgi:hypothetical protein
MKQRRLQPATPSRLTGSAGECDHAGMTDQVNGGWDTEVELLGLVEELEQRPPAASVEPTYGVVLVNLVGLRHINRTLPDACGRSSRTP